MLVIKLLKCLSGKYFINFHLTDEGRYWETGDEKIVEEIFKRYKYFLDEVSNVFENFPIKGDETFEAYFERVLK